MMEANWTYVDWDEHLAEVVRPTAREVRVDWFVVWSWFGVGLFVGAFWLTVAFIVWGRL